MTRPHALLHLSKRRIPRCAAAAGVRPRRILWGVVLAALAASLALATYARADGVAYLLRIGGIEDDELRKLLQRVSRLKRL